MNVSKDSPSQIVAFEQTGRGRRLTLRNNGGQLIRNSRYRVSYFGVADGIQVGRDVESVIARDIPPHVTWIFELSNDAARRNVYASFTVLSWDATPAP